MTKPSDVMRTWFDRVWCKREEAAIDEILDEQGVVHGIGPEPVVGPAAFKAFWRAINESFDTAQIDVVDAVDEGEMTYVRCEGTMTFQGKTVSLSGGVQCRIRDGKIVEGWNYWDFIGLMSEMGALPADAFPRSCAGECFGAVAAG